METIVNKLIKEVNGENRPEKVCVLENLAAENIADVSKEESFYKIPVQNIVSIASKTELSEYEDALDIIKRVISGTLKAHPDNQESIHLLQAFKLDDLPQLNLAECVDIFQTFTNIDLCVKLGEQFSLPEVDYECLLEQKTNQYEQLKQQNEQLKQDNTSLEWNISNLQNQNSELFWEVLSLKDQVKDLQWDL